MSEIECEIKANCNNDESSFKAYLSRWMAVTMFLAPFTAPQIQPKLAASAQGAAGQCVGGTNGRMCGRRWYETTWDGSSGVGQQVRLITATTSRRNRSNVLWVDVRSICHWSQSDDILDDPSQQDDRWKFDHQLHKRKSVHRKRRSICSGVQSNHHGR